MCGPTIRAESRRPTSTSLLISGKGGVHHIWGCDHFKTTLNATEFKRVYKRRTDLVKAAMDSVPAGDRDGQIKAIMDAIGKAACSSWTSISCRPRSAAARM